MADKSTHLVEGGSGPVPEAEVAPRFHFRYQGTAEESLAAAYAPMRRKIFWQRMWYAATGAVMLLGWILRPDFAEALVDVLIIMIAAVLFAYALAGNGGGRCWPTSIRARRTGTPT